MKVNTSLDTLPNQRRVGKLLATPLLGLLFCAGSAAACVEYGINRDLLLDKMYDTYPETERARFDSKFAARAFRDCPERRDVPVFMTLEMPGLTYQGEVTYKGNTYPAYAAAPDAPLVMFYHHVANSEDGPLRNGEEVPGLFEMSGGAGVNEAAIQYWVVVFSRGGRMRTPPPMVGTITLRAPSLPSIDTQSIVRLDLKFPAATCPLQDKAETLQDVQTAELSVPGSTAKEKLVAIRMDCGADAPRARMTLSDAGDASNTGSQLTPTADSDAEGVRVQLLRNGSEVQFGQTWDFEPGVGGVHDHQFTARYIRTNETLVPGTIKGEAVLNVDYW
ncbi:fimbrial protein [Stenotrophomonas maltophilia]|nr:fimbrial protein [Stenotrophomonas maltophilia]